MRLKNSVQDARKLCCRGIRFEAGKSSTHKIKPYTNSRTEKCTRVSYCSALARLEFPWLACNDLGGPFGMQGCSLLCWPT